MKPITLSMQAFGPFADKQVIDFTRLGSNPLFLINGPTGSGKTSILDALCYALYGETTGNERDAMQMRCDLAPDEMRTTVTLDFKLNQHVYRITRSPEQSKPKRGGGFTTAKHAATITCLGETEVLISNKTSQVKHEVIKLIGLNETQFRQVMVLPQGKFRELLLASSKDREDIFGQLFQTDIYKRIEYALKEKASDITRAKNEFDNQIRGALQVVNLATPEELTEQLSQVKTQLDAQQAETDKVLAATQQAEHALQQGMALSQQFERQQQAQQALIQHQQTSQTHQANEHRLQQALAAKNIEAKHQAVEQQHQQIQNLQADIARTQAQREQNTQQLEKARITREKAQKAAGQVALLTEEQYQLNSIKTALQDKQALAASIKQCEQAETKLSAELAKYEQHKAQLEQQTSDAAATLKTTIEQKLQSHKVEAEIQQLIRSIKDLQHLEEINNQNEQLNKHINKAQKQVAIAQEQQQQAQVRADTIEMHWYNGQAAVLAQKLRQQMPCPVCGSEEHPQPAVFDEHEVSKTEVQQARQQATKAYDKTGQAQSDLQQYQQQLTQNQTRQHELSAELGDIANSDINAQQAALLQLQQRSAELQKMDVDALEQEVRTLEQRCKNGEQRIAAVVEKKTGNHANLCTYQKQYNTLCDSIDAKYVTAAEVETEIERIKSKVTALNQALEHAVEDEHKANNALSANEGSIKANQQYLKQAEQRHNEATQSWQQVLRDSLFSDEADFSNAQLEDTDISDLQQTISAYKDQQLKLQQTLADLDTVLHDKTPPDIQVLQVNCDHARQTSKNASNTLNDVRSTYQQLHQVQQNIDSLRDKNTKLESQYQIYGTLYEVTSGKTGSRVSLHRFVLGVLLDDVLIQASQRLELMSKGRYRLLRKTAGFKGAAGRGLDLMVEDSYTSRSRDVATLSGGESFMAALALALGLSDVVQSYSGGIRLETLFIDEGFGSLDPESLDLAIQTLVDLQQNGRTIGVISHVTELKEQMGLRIDVIPSRVGSKVLLAGR